MLVAIGTSSRLTSVFYLARVGRDLLLVWGTGSRELMLMRLACFAPLILTLY